jgi:hypothetical protein
VVTKSLSQRSVLPTIVRHSLLGACIGALAGFFLNLLSYAYDNLVHGAPGDVGTILGIFFGIAWVIGSFPLILLVDIFHQNAVWLPPLNLALWGIVIGAVFGWYRARKKEL